MSRYKPYPKYKESGVEWLGDIPEHWTATNLKYIANINMGQSPSSETYNNEGIGIEFLQGNADFGDRYPTARTFTTDPKKISKPEDILFTVRAPVGAMNIGKRKYAIGRGLCSINSTKQTSNAFLWWLMFIVKSELDTVATGSTYEAVSVEQVNNAIVLLPSLSEQTTIAKFLDRETAKIDTLIAKQERLIALLAEKRQALISHAVTKGLDPNVKMKDSGVEWLGEVPEHWEVKKTKHFFRLIVEPAPKNNSYELLSIYTDIGVKPRKDLEQKGNKSTTTDGYWMVEKGDLIVNKLLAWMGAVGRSDYTGVTSPAYDILRANKNVDSTFYHYLFRTKIVQQEFKRWSRGIMEMRLRLYFSELGNIYMPLPTLHEQQKIVKFIANFEYKTDKLIEKAKQAITLLKERRTALISAVVTGKIKVNDEVRKNAPGCDVRKEV